MADKNTARDLAWAAANKVSDTLQLAEVVASSLEIVIKLLREGKTAADLEPWLKHTIEPQLKRYNEIMGRGQ